MHAISPERARDVQLGVNFNVGHLLHEYRNNNVEENKRRNHEKNGKVDRGDNFAATRAITSAIGSRTLDAQQKQLLIVNTAWEQLLHHFERARLRSAVGTHSATRGVE